METLTHDLLCYQMMVTWIQRPDFCVINFHQSINTNRKLVQGSEGHSRFNRATICLKCIRNVWEERGNLPWILHNMYLWIFKFEVCGANYNCQNLRKCLHLMLELLLVSFSVVILKALIEMKCYLKYQSYYWKTPNCFNKLFVFLV